MTTIVSIGVRRIAIQGQEIAGSSRSRRWASRGSGFWVEQEFRGLGVATKLRSKAVAYLKSRGCTGIVLHSSKAGEALYRSLGPSRHMNCE
ncbi:GNAT family N-acetyltransferase [Rhizobium sp. 42MFCr.1]|uniref:GNAT family N-acetyltransferase n=1 Tax=Rhizobium sp. 42MFCr.1 TaxID=1048680 RepID=UPI0012EC3D5C